MMKKLVSALIALALLSGGCSFAAKPPANPAVTAQGAVVNFVSPQDVSLRAYGPEVSVDLGNPSGVAQEVTVTLNNIRGDAVTVGGLIPVSRELISPSVVRFRFRLPPLSTSSVAFGTPTGEVFSFAVIGDNRDGRDVYRRLLTRLNQANPAFVINGGDLVSSGTAAEYGEFLKDSAILTVPYFTVLGNHDIQHDGRGFYNSLLAPNYYDFVWGNCQFLVLDNADGGMDEVQLKWLENKLRNRTTKHVFLVMHRPPFDPRPHARHAVNSPALGEKLMALAAEYKVSAVFASHIHLYWQGVRQGIPYYITGGAGAPLYAGSAEGGIYHYVWVSVSGDNVSVTAVELNKKE